MSFGGAALWYSTTATDMRYPTVAWPHGSHPEEITLDIPQRWSLCFALEPYIFRKIEEAINQIEMMWEYEHRELWIETQRDNIKRLVDLYFTVSAWETDDEKEKDPIWLWAFEKQLEELRNMKEYDD